jgi:protein-S-isoprenylcysteine O-methyltransferase Ste14
MKRWWFLVYGIGGHLMFLLVFAYLCGFVGNLLVPKSIDRPVTGSAGMAAAVDLLLVALFALQHSLMARPAFKEIWTRVVPQPIERATYVWIANAVTILLMWQWRPIDLVVWDVRQPAARGVVWGLFGAGWLAVPLVSLLIHHFDLFGTRQVWLHWQRKPYTPLPFRTPLAYARVRHPLYLGWALAFWAAPTMTVGHLLFAGSLTVYMMLAAVIEERDLVAYFGRAYRDYQQTVPMFVPRLGRARKIVKAAERPTAEEAALAPREPRAQKLERAAG